MNFSKRNFLFVRSVSNWARCHSVLRMWLWKGNKCGPHHPVLRCRYNCGRAAEQDRRPHAGASASRCFDLQPPTQHSECNGKGGVPSGQGSHLLDLCQRHGCSAAQKCVLLMLMLKWFAKFTGLEKGNQDSEGGSCGCRENLKDCPLRCVVYLGTRKAEQNKD